MPIDYSINADPIGNILQHYYAPKQMKLQLAGEQQRQQALLANQQREGAQYGNEHYLTPTEGPGGFVNGYAPNSGQINNDLGNVERMMPHAFPGSNDVESQQAAADAEDARRAKEIVAARMAAAGPSGNASGADGAISRLPPQQDPGEPRPALIDHKAKGELIKQEANNNAEQLKTIGQNASGQNVAVPQQTNISGDDTTVVGEEKKPWSPSPNMMTHMMATATSQPNVNFDPLVSVDILPKGAKGEDISAALRAKGITQIPTSLAKGIMSGAYHVQGAEINMLGGAPQGAAAPYIARARAGEDPGSLIEEAAGAGIPMTKGFYKGLNDAAHLHVTETQQAANRNQRAQMGAQQRIDSDQLLNLYQQRIDGADKMVGLLDNAGKGNYEAIPQVIAQANSELAALEAGKANPALGKLERTEIDSYENELQGFLNKVTGLQQGADNTAIIRQLKGMMGDLSNSYRTQYDHRMNFLKSTALPNQKDIYNKAHQTSGEQNSGYTAEMARAKELLQQYAADPKLGGNIGAKRREVIQFFKQKYPKVNPDAIAKEIYGQ